MQPNKFNTGRQLLQNEEIHGLTALSTVEPQLSQYEALVVANLGNELIEVFLDFNAHSTRRECRNLYED